jgi:cytochrome c553
MNFRLIAALAAGMLGTTGAYAAGDAAAGAKIATTVCVACHAADGNSVMTANPKLAGQHAEYLVKQLKDLKAGKRNNPVMGPMAATLSDEDVLNVAAYFSAQNPKAGAAKSNGAGSVGEKIYKGGIASKGVPACAACHGPSGAGIPVQFPRVAGQHAEYLTNQLKAFRSGERANGPMMKTIAAKMSDEDIAAVTDYMQGLK